MKLICKASLLFFVFLSAIFTAQSQNSVSIGTTNTKAKAVLWLKSSGGQGLLLPSVSTAERTGMGLNTSDEPGMIVYDNQIKQVFYWDGANWNSVSGGSSSSQDLSINGNQIALTGDATPISIAAVAPTSTGQLLMWDNAAKAWTSTLPLSASATNQVLQWNGTSWTTTALAAGSTPDGVTIVLNGGNLSVKTGTAATNIVQLDANAKLPAVNGSQLTSLNAASISTGTLPLANGGTGITNGAPGNNKILSTDATGAVNWSAISGDVTLTSGSLKVTQLNGKLIPPFAAGALTSDNSGNLSWVAAGGTGTVTQVTAGTGLTGGVITTSGTMAVDVGTTASKIVQLDANAKLPAIDGSQLTNLPASTVADGSITGGTAGPGVKIAATTITNANISTSAGIVDTKLATISTAGKVSGSAISGTIGGSTIINTTGNITGGNISGNGSGLTSLNASNISSGTLALARITTGSGGNVLTMSSGVPTWLPPATNGTVTTVTATLPISVASGSTTPALTITQATATVDGYLKAGDWNTFNSKLDNKFTTTGDLIYQSGSGPNRLAIGSVGDVLTVAAGGLPSWGPLSGWSTTGNPGTSPTANFIGTTDPQDLVFKTKNVENMRILNTNGYVGIGTTTPFARLEIAGPTIWESALGLINTGGGTEWRITSDTDGALKFVKASGATVTPLFLGKTGEIGANGSYGSSGQVLTSQGAGTSATWSTFLAPIKVVANTNAFEYIGNSAVRLGINNSVGQYEFGQLGSTAAVFSTDWNSGDTYIMGNLGVGVNPPTAKVDVSGDVNIKGEVNRTASTGTANMIPIAYGAVDSNGNILSGTGNFSVATSGLGVHDITITNETYSNAYITSATITQNGSGGQQHLLYTMQNGGSLRVVVTNTSGSSPGGVWSGYHFIVYKP